MNRSPLTAVVFALLGPLVAPGVGGVALLRNGSLLEGEVSRVGDQVIVRSEGATLRLPIAAVAFTGESASEAFQWRRSQSGDSISTIEDHLHLADWALTNRLTAEAALEILEARQIDPSDLRIGPLERRLSDVLRPAADPAPPRTESATATSDAGEAPLPRLPAEGVAHFTRRIQPLLLNGCGAGGCHGGVRPDDPFALDRASLHGRANAVSTQANLRTIVAAIDLGSPSRSPLLAAAHGPHAGVAPFAGPRRDELVERLTRWVYEVAAENAVTIPPPEPLMAASGGVGEPAAPVVTEPGPYRPRDEFDPEIFNRRYRTAAAE